MESSLSYLHTPNPVPYRYINVPDSLDLHALEVPDREAYVLISKDDRDANKVVFAREHVTFKDIADKSRHIAGCFLGIGLKSGDRVAIIGPPSIEWLYVEYAVLRINVLLVRVPGTLAQSDQLPEFLARHKCRVLVLDHRAKPAVLRNVHSSILNFHDKAACSQLSARSSVFPEMVLLRNLQQDIQSSMTILGMLEQPLDSKISEEVALLQSRIDLEDPAVVYATTGTTGQPKLVVYSHLQYVDNFSAILDYPTTIGSRGDDVRFFNNRPYTWSGSFVLAPASLGWTMVCMDEELSEHNDTFAYILQTLESERIKLAFLPVFLMHSAIAKQNRLPTSLEYILTAGEKVFDSVMATLLQHVRAVYVIYGCSEALGAATSGRLDEHIDDSLVDASARYRPLADCQIKITSEDGQVLPKGQAGTIWMKGRCLIEYLDDRPATDAIKTSSGWVNTKDAGIIHHSGFLQVIGRTSDLISKGGCKIYPITIENMLMKCPKVSKVVVVATPDDKYGQEIGACVVPNEGDILSVGDLEAFCKAHGTSTGGITLYPRFFVICYDLPLMKNGKTDFMKCKEMVTEAVERNLLRYY